MSKRSQQDQCSVCRKSCNGDDLFCRSCGDLFHSRCEQITAGDFRYFQRASVDYICVQCRQPRDIYACSSVLNRLQCCDLQLIKEVAKREQLFLKYENFEASFFNFHFLQYCLLSIMSVQLLCISNTGR